MPSDTPPRPFGLLRPNTRPGGAPPSAGAGQQPAAAPGGVDPHLRRFWQREGEALDDLVAPPRRAASSSVAWGALIAMALIAAVLIRQGPALLEPPPRILTPLPPGVGISVPGPGVTGPGPQAVAAEPALLRAFGTGAINQSGARVARVGRVAEHAIACGLRPRAWVNDARDALVQEIATQYPSFENDAADIPRLRQYLAVRFQHDQQQAPQDLGERGQQEICDNLPYAPEFGQLNTAARQAGIRVE